MLRIFPLFLLVPNICVSPSFEQAVQALPIQVNDKQRDQQISDEKPAPANVDNTAVVHMDASSRANQSKSTNVTKLDDHMNNNNNKDTELSQKLSDSSSKSESSVINKTAVKADPEPQVESGVVIRGICVMVGLSFVFILYLGIKNYSKKNPSKTALVRKYGVRTRRNDVEMEPLPLSDDEDETLFDLGSLNNKQ